MFKTKSVTAPAEFKAEDGEGAISAVFSTFDVVDSVGDIVDRSAFTSGQSVPMVWAHDWSRPIGKGVVKVEPERAVFKGSLFLDTTDGLDAYRTIKAMGDLQEYSWGFQILDAAEEVRDGQPIRVIKKAELFEVSPVLVGANRETYTLAIKARRRLSRGQIEAVITTLQALLGDDDPDTEEVEGLAGDSLSDDGKAADLEQERSAIALDLAGIKLADDLAAFVDRLRSAEQDEQVSAKDAVAGLLRRLSSARIDLDLLLKRADDAAVTNPRELLSAFERLTGLYGPVHSGRRAG